MRYELNDFSGGITDYILSGDVTCCELLDNALIDKDKTIIGRDGSRVMGEGFLKPSTSVIEAQSILELLNDDIVFVYGKDILVYQKETGWVEPIGFEAFGELTEGDVNSNQSISEWNKHLFITDDSGSKPVKLFKNKDGLYTCITTGLPNLESKPTVFPSRDDGRAYIYTFCYVYEYYVEDTLFADYGPTTTVQVLNSVNFVASNNIISSLPELVNTSKSGRDIDNVKIHIYRTTNGDTVGYLVASVDNGVTSYNDTTDDDTLVNGQSLYTNNGILSNAEPPVAKYLEICNGCGWYANLAGFPYRVMQSQIADPDSVPPTYYLDFENGIKGISSFQSNPIVFTDHQVFRIEGVINLDGTGYQRKVLIADRVGCINSSSIVKTDSGLYFAGTDSFYWTNGYELKMIPSREKNIYKRYKTLAAYPKSIKGAYDQLGQRIYWTTKSSSNTYQIYVYDATFNSLTTFSGTHNSFNTTSVEVTKNGNLIRGDESGYVFIHDSNLFSDPEIDNGKPTIDWKKHTVVFNWKHIAFDFGVSGDINKWVTRITVSGEGGSDLDLAIYSHDDAAGAPKELHPINFKSGLTWEDYWWKWGESDSTWETTLRLQATRWFKSGKLRCKRKQLQITSAKVSIVSSIDGVIGSRLSVNGTTKLCTLVDSSLVSIPPSGSYELVVGDKSFPIVSNDESSVLVTDALSKLVDGVFEWKIVGVRPNQRAHLTSLIYTFETLDDKGGYYQKDSNV